LAAQGPQLLEQALSGTSFGGAAGLVEHLAQSGLGDQVASMASGGQASLSPDLLKGVLGDEHVQQMAQQFGVQPDQVFSLIAEHLPALLQQKAS